MAQDTLARVLAMANSGGGSSDYNDLENKPVAGDGIDISSTTVPVISAKVDGETIVINEDGELSGAASVEIDEKTIIENPLTGELETQVGGWKEVSTEYPFPDGAPTIPTVTQNGYGGDWDGYTNDPQDALDFIDAIETGKEYAITFSSVTYFTYEEMDAQGYGYLYDYIPLTFEGCYLKFNNKDSTSIGMWENAMWMRMQGNGESTWWENSAEFYVESQSSENKSKYHFVPTSLIEFNHMVKSCNIVLDNTSYQVTTYHAIDPNYINTIDLTNNVGKTTTWDTPEGLHPIAVDENNKLTINVEGSYPITLYTETSWSGQEEIGGQTYNIFTSKLKSNLEYDQSKLAVKDNNLTTIFDASITNAPFNASESTPYEVTPSTSDWHNDGGDYYFQLEFNNDVVKNVFDKAAANSWTEIHNVIYEGASENIFKRAAGTTDDWEQYSGGGGGGTSGGTWYVSTSGDITTLSYGDYIFYKDASGATPIYYMNFSWGGLDPSTYDYKISIYNPGRFACNEVPGLEIPCSPEFIPIDNDTLVIDNGVIKAGDKVARVATLNGQNYIAPPNNMQADGDLGSENGGRFKNAYFSGNVKAANVPLPPSVDGTYTLEVTVSQGEASYSWIARV